MSDSGGEVVIGLLSAGPAAGWFVYARIKAKYRNANARYMPERVVAYKVDDLKVEDAFKAHVTSYRREIDGRNDNKPEVRAPYVNVTKE